MLLVHTETPDEFVRECTSVQGVIIIFIHVLRIGGAVVVRVVVIILCVHGLFVCELWWLKACELEVVPQGVWFCGACMWLK